MSLEVIIADSMFAHEVKDRDGVAGMIQDTLLHVLVEPSTIREVLTEWEEKKGFINAENLTYADVALILECLRSVLLGGEDG